MSTTVHKTARYMFATHRGRGASFTRLRDNTSVFFQPGDDATAIADDVQNVLALPDIADKMFDSLASEYQPGFDAHFHHRKHNS